MPLLENPAVLHELRAHPEFMRNAVDELVRYDSPVQMVTRWAYRDEALHGRDIHRGDKVVLVDDMVFHGPKRFVLRMEPYTSKEETSRIAPTTTAAGKLRWSRCPFTAGILHGAGHAWVVSDPGLVYSVLKDLRFSKEGRHAPPWCQAGAAARNTPVDLVSGLAYPLPLTIICTLLGLPRDVHPAMRNASEKIFFGGSAAVRDQGPGQLYSTVAELIDHHPDRISDGLITDLLALARK